MYLSKMSIRKFVREALSLGLLAACLLAARSTLADHYYVPSGSMQPTLMSMPPSPTRFLDQMHISSVSIKTARSSPMRSLTLKPTHQFTTSQSGSPMNIMPPSKFLGILFSKISTNLQPYFLFPIIPTSKTNQ